MSCESFLDSACEQNVTVTSPNFVTQRSKLSKEYDYASEFATFKEDMKTLIATMMAPQQAEFKKIYPTLMEIKSTNSNIEVSMAALTAQNSELKKKLERIEVQAKTDRDYIATLEDKLEDLQRGSRKANIEIKNVPKLTKESKEDLIKMAISLSNEIDCRIEANDIGDIYRVQNKRRDVKNSPIIVELASTITKSEFLKMSKSFNIRHKEKLCAKHLGFTKEEYTPIFVSEQLTAKGARLHFLARDLAKSKQYKFCWTAYGRVYVRKDESSSIIAIKTESQVSNLMQLN